MNEKDLILKQKIEKREKFDVILAYILLVILIICVVFILYLKFIREEDTNLSEEYVPNYISINEISNSLNNSTLANRYLNDTASFNSSVVDNSLIVTYIKDNTNINLNIPVIGNELAITILEDNADIITDIYKEIASIICVYYGNGEDYCRNTLENINSENTVEGIRFVNNDNTNIVYIIITKSIEVNTDIVYTEVTKKNINDTNYTLRLLDNKIYNINVNITDTDIIFAGDIERLTDDTSNLSLIVKIYNAEGNVLDESKYEYNENNILEKNGSFQVSFVLSDTLKVEDITNYSIEISK